MAGCRYADKRVSKIILCSSVQKTEHIQRCQIKQELIVLKLATRKEFTQPPTTGYFLASPDRKNTREHTKRGFRNSEQIYTLNIRRNL